MFDFHFQQGRSRRKLFQVKGSHCTIGSARDNDLVINTRRVAKRHAELREERDGIYVRDLGSLGGCRVNGERIVDKGPCLIRLIRLIRLAHLTHLTHLARLTHLIRSSRVTPRYRPLPKATLQPM